MSNDEDQTVPWTKERIVALAKREFPEDFAALPGGNAFKFKHISQFLPLWLNYTGHQELWTNPICSEPKGLVRTLVEIGVYDDEDSTLHGTVICAYICERTTMGFVAWLEDHTPMKVPTTEPFVSEILWGSPFDAVIKKGLWTKTKPKVKAIALWALLAAGYQDEFLFYRSFQADFKPAVQWIAAAARESTEEGENDASMEVDEGLDRSTQITSPRNDARRSKKRRKTESDIQPHEFGASHRQAQAALDSMAKNFNDLQKQVNSLREGNIKLLGENSKLRDENIVSKTSAQAYITGDNRKDIEIAKLREELDKAEQREFQQWKRANDFERQLKEANERNFKDEK